MISIIPIFIPVLVLLLMAVFSLIDYKKKREITERYFISFIVPCYNNAETIEKTIKSIYSSYDKDKFELFIINDRSKDNSLKKIKKLAQKYKFKIIDNKENLGKARAINNIFDKAKGEIIFVVDADTIITEKAVDDIISRFNYDKKVGGVSCSYKVRGKGFLSLMQAIEYNILSFVWYSHNVYSTICLTGGCLAVKKEAFKEVGKFSENALCEDSDLAMKLNKHNWRVEQSKIRVETSVPEDFKAWFKQKIRWNGGSIQTVLNYPTVIIKNPIAMCISAMYVIILYFVFVNSINMAFFYYNLSQSLFFLVNHAGFGIANALIFLTKNSQKELALTAVYQSSFLIFNIPYTLRLIKKIKDINKILLVIPFSLIYYPLFCIAFVFGSFKGIKYFIKLKNADRAW